MVALVRAMGAGLATSTFVTLLRTLSIHAAITAAPS